MPKSDDKGEPVKTVTIGGKKVEVPIIFILPEEAGEKEIERYQHPKVHIESKKVAPLLAGAGAATGVGTAAGGVAATGKKIGEGVKDTAAEGIGAIGEGAKLSETLSADSEEKPLEELTHGKLEEVEKLPYKDQLQGTVMDETRAVESGKVRPKQNKHLIDPKWKGENTPYFNLLSPEKPKKKKKKRGNSYEELLSAEKDCKDGKCSKKPSKPDYDPSKVADEKYFKTEAEARAVKGATSVLRHRTGLFSPVFGDKKELDRVQAQLKDHNDKNPTFFDSFDPEQSISDLSGESQEKAKGFDSGDDDPRRHGRRPDKDYGEGRRPHREDNPDRHKPKRSTIDRLREHQADVKSGKWKPPNDDDVVSLVEDYDEHTEEDKKDIELARDGKVALPMVERKVRGEKRPSLYAETVGRRSLMAGLNPEQAGQNMHMATISEDNAEKYKAWLQKRDDWDEEERDMTDAYFGRKKKKKKKRSDMEDLDIEVDSSDAFGIDKLKALQLEIKDALKPEKNQGKMSTEEFGGRSGRNPKTGRELNDYLEDQSPYGFGKLGKKEPQTSRGQADDATQERAMNYYSAKDPRSGRASALKKPAREAGENTVRGDARIDQHEPKSHETASSGNDWKSSNRVGREMYDQEPISEIKEEDYDKEGKLSHHKIRKVPRTGKAPTEGKQPMGRIAQFTGNEKLMRQMAGYPPSYFEDTYDKEEERRRDAKLPKGGKRPKGTTGKKKAWEEWLENKSLGALGWGKLNRDGTKQKLRKRKKKPPTLDDFTGDNGDKKDET